MGAPAPAAPQQLRVLATLRPLRAPLAVRPDILSFPPFFLPQATPLRRPLRRRQAAGRRLPRRSRRQVFQTTLAALFLPRPAPLMQRRPPQTINGAMAKALSTINPSTDEAAGTSEATAKTSFGGVSVQSDVTNTIFPDFVTVEAIAQGGSGQTSLDQGAFWRYLDRPSRQGLRYDADRGREQCRRRVTGTGRRDFRDRHSELPGKLDIRFQFSGRSAAWRDRRRCRHHCQRPRCFRRRHLETIPSSIWVPSDPTLI